MIKSLGKLLTALFLICIFNCTFAQPDYINGYANDINGHIYSWIPNNYLTTNFKARRFGELDWKYQITSLADNSNTFATKFGWGNRVSLITRVNSRKQNSIAQQQSKSLFDLNTANNLLLVSSLPTPDGKEIPLYLSETEGEKDIIDVPKLLQNQNIKAIYETNSIGEVLNQLTTPLLVEHHEAKFILLKTTN